ncbi:hypothetical protein ACFQX7_00790 [Luedemannella flava]
MRVDQVLVEPVAAVVDVVARRGELLVEPGEAGGEYEWWNASMLTSMRSAAGWPCARAYESM